MQDLTFGEQVKIILGRKGMTIKQLAELIEEKTGKKMSRQNLTQRLGRDNFQEQDMRMIAEMLECPFHLSIMSAEGAGEVRSIAALERAAAARVEAVEASGHKELTAKEQAEAEFPEYSTDFKGAEPGQIVAVLPHTFFIGCGKDLLKVNEVQAEGKKRMTSDAFLRGSRLEKGMELGK